MSDNSMGQPTNVERVLGAPLFERAARPLSRSRLRVLGYHAVDDPVCFERQIRHLRDHYHPVSGSEVIDHFRDGRPLPPLAVWVTFDDGRPSVVEQALPVLTESRVPATMFVCPGLLPEGSQYWQSVVLAGLRDGGPFRYRDATYTDRRLVIALKSALDGERRSVVEELRGRIAADAERPEDAVNEEQLRAWLGAGFEVGNHTWDHPCLDHCDPDEQRRQIVWAHERLTELIGSPPEMFAYPNGDWTPYAERVLRELGYVVSPAFDHRIASTSSEPLRLPRLRVDSDAPIDRFRAILSGTHSAIFHARDRLRGAAVVPPGSEGSM